MSTPEIAVNPEIPVDKNLQKYEELSKERKALQAKGDLPAWYTTPSWQMFKEKYAVEGEAAVRGRHRTIARTLARHMKGRELEWEELFFNEMWDGILSPASPALGNTGAGSKKGFMVSCSGQFVDDNVPSFYSNMYETALLSKYSFGTSADFSSIRPRGALFGDGGEANGAADVIEDFFTVAAKISQGSKRRGSIGAYLDIEHADWDECVDKLLHDHNGRNYGWVIRDSFIDKLKADDPEANRRWNKALYAKMVSGKGYIFCVDKANRHRPQMYKEHGLDIKASNLCSEIMLHSSEEYTYSCILSSLNLVHWDRIKTSNSVFIATVFLDCMCSEFIETSKGVPGMDKVRKFTEMGRAIGLGIMGFHTMLQSKGIPYVSLEARFLSSEISKHLHDESLRASQWLAKEYGEPEWCKGYGVRNTHRTAYAPTKTTALLMGGVSESWFPEPGAVYDMGSSVGEIRRITPVAFEMMKERGVYNKETITRIIQHAGSLQQETWLSEEEKNVFLFAYEMDQNEIFIQAMGRQKYTCQGQSLNFYFPENGSEDKIAEIMTKVLLHPDCLSQYYIYSKNGVIIKDECLSCSA